MAEAAVTDVEFFIQEGLSGVYCDSVHVNSWGEMVQIVFLTVDPNSVRPPVEEGGRAKASAFANTKIVVTNEVAAIISNVIAQHLASKRPVVENGTPNDEPST